MASSGRTCRRESLILVFLVGGLCPFLPVGTNRLHSGQRRRSNLPSVNLRFILQSVRGSHEGERGYFWTLQLVRGLGTLGNKTQKWNKKGEETGTLIFFEP